MAKKIVFFIAFMSLMAFQCEKDPINAISYNRFIVNVSPQFFFAVNDTIWIEGKVSSKVFDSAINDSIQSNGYRSDEISVFKCIVPTSVANCKDALNQFELITERELSFLPICENGQLVIDSQLIPNENSYHYRIGLRALHPGDYVLSWTQSKIINPQRNEFLMELYPLSAHPQQLGMNRCGSVSWRYIHTSDREYYFRVQ